MVLERTCARAPSSRKKLTRTHALKRVNWLKVAETTILDITDSTFCHLLTTGSKPTICKCKLIKFKYKYGLTAAATAAVTMALLLAAGRRRQRARARRPAHTGRPSSSAGAATPASSAMPSGAPASVPSCQSSFFLRDQGALPQKVQPEGLENNDKVRKHKVSRRISHILIYRHIIRAC